jgi:hypothetical protein
MWSLVVAMVVILAVAALVMLYVAFPHRGQQVPKASWLGRLLSRAAERVPVMKDGERDDHDATRR